MKDTVYYVPIKNADRLRKAIYHACLLYTIVTFIGSLSLFFYYSSVTLRANDPAHYLLGLRPQVYYLRFLIIPMIPCIIGLLSGYFSIFGIHTTTKTKNQTTIWLLFLVTAIPYIFYHLYPALIIGPCITSFICILFAERKQVLFVYIGSLLSLALNLAGSLRERSGDTVWIPESIIALTIFTVVYLINRTLIKFQIGYYKELQIKTDEKTKLDTETKLDPFTGLYNRKELFSILSEEIEKRKSMYTPLYFCIFDIDNFKQINDTYGHPTGDIVLLSLCSIIKEFLPSGCSAARYGGEEFALILPSLSGQESYRIVESIRVRFQNTRFDFLDNAKRRNITVSCGLVTFRDKQASTEALFASADALLYEAKNSGKNKTIFR